MKKLLFILGLTLALLLVGCTAESLNQDYNPTQNQQQLCGTIMSIGEDQRGDYIEVKMSYHNPSQRDRYQVDNYMDYQAGKQICNFDGLVKQPL